MNQRSQVLSMLEAGLLDKAFSGIGITLRKPRKQDGLNVFRLHGHAVSQISFQSSSMACVYFFPAARFKEWYFRKKSFRKLSACTPNEKEQQAFEHGLECESLSYKIHGKVHSQSASMRTTHQM